MMTSIIKNGKIHNMKIVLFVATVYKFLNFEKSDMELLKSMGYEIHTATNMDEAEWLKDDGSLDVLVSKKNHINFSRKPFSHDTIIAYKQLKALMDKEHYDIIHCHTPVAAAISRLASRKTRRKGTKVIYTDHGFHFHKHSGIKNWILYYPIEYISSIWTDMILAINKEDFGVIQNFPVKEKRYIPGVGVDVQRIMSIHVDEKGLRKRFGIPDNIFLILSVGELSVRKNHEVIIKAISMIPQKDIYYLICGTGEKRLELENLASQLGVHDRILFAGQVSHDTVLGLGHIASIGAIPSLIEGLGLAGIETLAAGKPIVGSNVHGIKDYVIDNVTGISCPPHDVGAFRDAIMRLYSDKGYYSLCSKNCAGKAMEFDILKVRQLMEENYKFIQNII